MTDETITRVLDPADAYCPKCGHNRTASSVSSINHGGGLRSCQFCCAKWYEAAADQVRAAVLEAKAQERERLALLVESMWEVDGSHTASLFAAAIRSGHSITETQRAEE